MITINDILFANFAGRVSGASRDLQLDVSDSEILRHLQDHVQGAAVPSLDEFKAAVPVYEAMLAASYTASKINSIESAVQRHLDAAAQGRGYDNIVSACSYAAAANSFQAEGIAYLNWRAAVWQHCYQALADVQAGTRATPTAAELIAELPVLVLP